MEYGFVHHSPVLEVLHHDPVQEFRRHAMIPDPFRVHDHNGPTLAHAEAGRFAPFHPIGTEQEILPLQQMGKKLVQFAATLLGRAVPAGAYYDVPRIWLHTPRHPLLIGAINSAPSGARNGGGCHIAS